MHPTHELGTRMRFLPLMILGMLAKVTLASDPPMETVPAEATSAGLEFHTGTVELRSGLA